MLVSPSIKIASVCLVPSSIVSYVSSFFAITSPRMWCLKQRCLSSGSEYDVITIVIKDHPTKTGLLKYMPTYQSISFWTLTFILVHKIMLVKVRTQRSVPSSQLHAEMIDRNTNCGYCVVATKDSSFTASLFVAS